MIAYFGEEGSFSHWVANQRFPKLESVSCPSVGMAFDYLKQGKASLIVVPIENASSGMITDTADQLITLAHEPISGFAIQECLKLKVTLALLARDKKTPVRKIFSHFAPFAHCKSWLKKHYPKAEQIVAASTSEAARLAKENEGSAAIAGAHAAPLYGLKVLHPHVAAEVANQTQFFVIGKTIRAKSKPTHTTVVFELPHKPGTLVALLQALAENGMNLTRIESRPIPGRFSEYRFLIEIEGSPKISGFKKGLERAASTAKFFQIMGTYPMVAVN